MHTAHITLGHNHAFELQTELTADAAFETIAQWILHNAVVQLKPGKETDGFTLRTQTCADLYAFNARAIRSFSISKDIK